MGHGYFDYGTNKIILSDIIHFISHIDYVSYDNDVVHTWDEINIETQIDTISYH